MLRYRHVAALHPDPTRIPAEFAAGPPTYARLFELFHAHHAERAGKARWGVQTGLIERHADAALRGLPGRADHPHGPRPSRPLRGVTHPVARGQGAGRGRDGTLALLHTPRPAAPAPPPRRLPVVRYEDLVLRTDDTLRRACASSARRTTRRCSGCRSAGTPGARSPGSPRPRRRHPTPAVERVRRPLPRARGGPGRGVHPAACRRSMREYGYGPVPLGWGAGATGRTSRRGRGRTSRFAWWRGGREAVEQRFPSRAGRRPTRAWSPHRTPECVAMTAATGPSLHRGPLRLGQDPGAHGPGGASGDLDHPAHPDVGPVLRPLRRPARPGEPRPLPVDDAARPGRPAARARSRHGCAGSWPAARRPMPSCSR